MGGVREPCFSQRKTPTASLKARLLGVTITNIIVNLSPGLTVKVQGQHSGSHMGAGDGLVTDGEYLAGAAGLPQGGGQVQRLRRGGGVGDTNRGGLILHQFFIQLDQRIHSLFTAALLAEHHDLALRITL